jgi:hypothetical protein
VSRNTEAEDAPKEKPPPAADDVPAPAPNEKAAAPVDAVVAAGVLEAKGVIEGAAVAAAAVELVLVISAALVSVADADAPKPPPPKEKEEPEENVDGAAGAEVEALDVVVPVLVLVAPKEKPALAVGVEKLDTEALVLEDDVLPPNEKLAPAHSLTKIKLDANRPINVQRHHNLQVSVAETIFVVVPKEAYAKRGVHACVYVSLFYSTVVNRKLKKVYLWTRQRRGQLKMRQRHPMWQWRSRTRMRE